MKIFIRELILSIILSLILVFALSVLLSTTDISENVIIPGIIGIASFSLMIGAYRISKKKKEKGILYGSTLGLSYMIILYLISSFSSFDFSLNLVALIMIILGIIGGAIGGILGVNF